MKACAEDRPVLPRFRSDEDRDGKCAAFAQAGGAMVDGMMCFVAGRLQQYRAGSWADYRPTS